MYKKCCLSPCYVLYATLLSQLQHPEYCHQWQAGNHLFLPPNLLLSFRLPFKGPYVLDSHFVGSCDSDSLMPRMLLDHYPNPSPRCGMSYLTDSRGSHLKAACFKRLHHRAQGLVWALHSWERTCCVQDRRSFCCAKFSIVHLIRLHSDPLMCKKNLSTNNLDVANSYHNHASTCHVSECSKTFFCVLWPVPERRFIKLELNSDEKNSELTYSPTENSISGSRTVDLS